MATATQVTPARTKSGSTTFGSVTKALDPSWLLGMGHTDTAKFEEAVKRCIPCEFLLIASQDDYTQAQEDYFAIDHFKLAPHVPRFVQKANAGSVATCALLQLMYENPKLVVADNLRPGDKPIDVMQLSKELRKRVKDATKLDAKPTISSSRPLGPPRLEKDAPAPFFIVPPKYTGTRRALLIGVVNGEGEDLKGTPNDVTMIHQFLTKECGFKPENVTVLQDYHRHGGPEGKSTKKNILRGFDRLIRDSKPGDCCFIQFSGHGGRMGNNLYILPSDYKTAGQIMDEEILRDLIKAMPADVYATMLVDCCYSGTVGDLPYVLQSGSSKQSIDAFYDTDMRKEMLQKESEDAEGYQQYKQARAEKRVMSRLTAAIVEGIGKAGAAVGSTAAAAVVMTGAAAATAAQAGLDVGMAVGSTAATGAVMAGSAALTVGKTGLDVAGAVGSTAASGAVMAGSAVGGAALTVAGAGLDAAGAGVSAAASGAAMAGTAALTVGKTGLDVAGAVGSTAASGAAMAGSAVGGAAMTVAGAGLDVASTVGKTGVSAAKTVGTAAASTAVAGLKGSANIATSAATAGLSASTNVATSVARGSAATASLAAAAAASTAMAGLKGSANVASSVGGAATAGLTASTNVASSVARNSAATASLAAAAAASTAIAGLKGSANVVTSVGGAATSGLSASTKVAAAGLRGSANAASNAATVLGTLPMRSKSVTDKPVFEGGKKADSLSLSSHGRLDREFANSANALLEGRRSTLQREVSAEPVFEGGRKSDSLSLSSHAKTDDQFTNSANALLAGRRSTLQREKSGTEQNLEAPSEEPEDEATVPNSNDSRNSTTDSGVRSSVSKRTFSHSPTRAAFAEVGRSRSFYKKKALYDAAVSQSRRNVLEDADSDDEFANSDTEPDNKRSSVSSSTERGRSLEPKDDAIQPESLPSDDGEAAGPTRKRSSSVTESSQVVPPDDVEAEEPTKKRSSSVTSKSSQGKVIPTDDGEAETTLSNGNVEASEKAAPSAQEDKSRTRSSAASPPSNELDGGSSHIKAPKRSSSGVSTGRASDEEPVGDEEEVDGASSKNKPPKRSSSGVSTGKAKAEGASSRKKSPKRNSSGVSAGKVNNEEADDASGDKKPPKRNSSGVSTGKVNNEEADDANGDKKPPKRNSSGVSKGKVNTEEADDTDGDKKPSKRSSSTGGKAKKEAIDNGSSHKRSSSVSRSAAQKRDSDASTNNSAHKRSSSVSRSAHHPKPIVIEDPIPRPRRPSKSPKRMGSSRFAGSFSSLGSSFRKSIKRSMSSKSVGSEGEGAAKKEVTEAAPSAEKS